MKKVVALLLCLFSSSVLSIDSKKIASKVEDQILNESESYNLSVSNYLQNDLSINNFLDNVNSLDLRYLSTEQLRNEFEIISTRLIIHHNKIKSAQSKKVILKLAMIQNKLKA